MEVQAVPFAFFTKFEEITDPRHNRNATYLKQYRKRKPLNGQFLN